MTTSALQTTSSLPPAKNMPSQWTFDLALCALRVPENQQRLSSLDQFLSQNSAALTTPELFQKKGEQALPASDELSIRGAKYTTSQSTKKAAEEISGLINVNKTEVLRVISEINCRIPEEAKTGKDNSTMTKEETQQMYIFGVLKDRRAVLQLTRFLLGHESISILGDKFSRDILEDAQYITKLLSSLDAITTDLQTLDNSYKEAIASELSHTIAETLKILVTILIKVATTDSNVVQWFKLMEKLQFFNSLKSFAQDDIYEEMHALSSIICLLFLGLNTKDDIFDPSAPYASQPTAVRTIHDIISNSPYDPVTLYAWSVVIYSLPDHILSSVFTDDENIETICKNLASRSAELGVFQSIVHTHKVLSYDPLYSAILSSFLICTVPSIQLTDNTSRTYYTVLKDAPNTFIEKFFTNPNTERLLYLTKAKFPEVITPYLRLLSINGAYAHNDLSSMSTYMSIVPNNSMDYEIDTEVDMISLTDGLLVKPPFEQNPDVLMLFPPQTKGKLIPTSNRNTEAVIFQHEYNGWSLLGRVLQNISIDLEQTELMMTILELITNTLAAADVDTTSEILESLSLFLDDVDILDVLLKMFEQSLHQRNVVQLTELTKLLIALVSTYPQIVWTHLVRSDLLEHGGRGGLIATILGSSETVNGTYDFTITILKLFNELIVDCLSHPDDELLAHKAEVIPKFTNHAAQVFESFMYWNYKESHQKFEIATLILDAFTKLLYGVYSVDPESQPSKKVTKVLASSSKRVITSFTVSLPDVRIIAPIIAAVDAIATAPSVFDTTARLGFAFTHYARSSLQFSKLVISIRSAIGVPPSTLESSLFVKSTQLITIYGKTYSLRAEVLQLLTQLVGAKWPIGSPSLLSHLGDHYTNILIASLTQDLKAIYDDFVVKKALYSFFSAVIEGNQKGLSMIFLNGRDIKDTKTDQPSLLNILKQDVKNMDYYPNWLSIHLVDALAFAFNSWSFRRLDEKEETEFVKTLVKKLTDSKPQAVDSDDSTEIIKGCYNYKLNAKMAEICALVIFPSKKEGSSQPIIELLNSKDIMELIKPFHEPFGYRAAVHDDLNKKFEEKWPQLRLDQFIRAPLAITNRYGEGAVYDLRLLDGMLGSDPSWTGTGLATGFRSQVIDASVNLQFISSQISAAKSWGALLIAYVKKVGPQASLIKITKKLLQANIAEGTSIALFEDVYRARTELAFFLLYSSTSVKPLEFDDTKEILDLALQLLTSIDVDFLSSLNANKSDVYRPLMRIIYRCLADTKGNPKIFEALTSELLEFFEVGIAKGSTLLFEVVQTNVSIPEVGGRIEDLLLIVSLFKALIDCKPPTSFTSRLSTILVDFNTLKSVLNVYANAHNLKVNDDLVFAELTLTFMTELISVDAIAEQLIAAGLFSTLIQSPVSMTIQEGGIFVQTNPKLHNIWTNGLLAIILILLSKFGVRLLSEISAFVSYFTKQFTTTIDSWSLDSVAITLPALQETEQIILLQKALQSLFHEYGQSSPSVKFDSLEIVPGLDTESGKKDLITSLNHLLAHPKYLTSRVIPTTVEEHRMFEGEDKIRTPLVEMLVARIDELKQTLSE